MTYPMRREQLRENGRTWQTHAQSSRRLGAAWTRWTSLALAAQRESLTGVLQGWAFHGTTQDEAAKAMSDGLTMVGSEWTIPWPAAFQADQRLRQHGSGGLALLAAPVKILAKLGMTQNRREEVAVRSSLSGLAENREPVACHAILAKGGVMRCLAEVPGPTLRGISSWSDLDALCEANGGMRHDQGAPCGAP